MLFNSFDFLFLFLPAVIFLIYLSTILRVPILPVLFSSSLIFYAWWDPDNIWILAASILFNFTVGELIVAHKSRRLLIFGILMNLLFLGIFKYANFFLAETGLAELLSISPRLASLPLAISFFTFQAIAYLVDSFRNARPSMGFVEYGVFVSFFPQLIAGPIVLHSEIIPQLSQLHNKGLSSRNASVGSTIFLIGLFKKVVIADGLAEYSDPVFAAATQQEITFLDAWTGTIAYSFQIYFDFSGYSDMAVGLARMFGVRLPVNFLSPYKATSIREFWRRWHMTLSRFVLNYIYIPLGGNRLGPSHQAFNLIMIMAIVGLWHGAGWTFILWGGVHGVMLFVNHVWQLVCSKLHLRNFSERLLPKLLSCGLTFFVVTVAWVLFRAESIDVAINIYKGLIGTEGRMVFPESYAPYFSTFIPLLSDGCCVYVPWGGDYIFGGARQIVYFLIVGMIVFICPNAYDWLKCYSPVLLPRKMKLSLPFHRLRWRPNAINLSIMLVLFTVSAWKMRGPSPVFLYFQF